MWLVGCTFINLGIVCFHLNVECWLPRSTTFSIKLAANLLVYKMFGKNISCPLLLQTKPIVLHYAVLPKKNLFSWWKQYQVWIMIGWMMNWVRSSSDEPLFRHECNLAIRSLQRKTLRTFIIYTCDLWQAFVCTLLVKKELLLKYIAYCIMN